MRRNMVPGLILIAIGLILLMVSRVGFGGDAVLLLIGSVFLVAYAWSRLYGLLIPGCILMGIGGGILAESRGVLVSGAPVLLGMGVGFLAIYLVDRLVEAGQGGWWPVIPGSILSFIGVLLVLEAEHVLRLLGEFWPLALVLAGLWILLTSRRSSGSSEE